MLILIAFRILLVLFAFFSLILSLGCVFSYIRHQTRHLTPTKQSETL